MKATVEKIIVFDGARYRTDGAGNWQVEGLNFFGTASSGRAPSPCWINIRKPPKEVLNA